MAYRDDVSSQGGGGYILNDEVIALNEAWRTEVNAFEILQFKGDIVDSLLEKLRTQQVRNGT